MTASDLERARDFAKSFNDCDFDETYGGGVAILDSGLERIAKLISEVRNETLRDLVKDIDNAAKGYRLRPDQMPTPFVNIAFKHSRGASIFRNKLTRSLKTQTSKEGEK